MSHRSQHKGQRGRPHRREPIEKRRVGRGVRFPLATDLLILSDGTVLAHNLTPVMAAVLHKLNPKDRAIRRRAFTVRRRLAAATADFPGGTSELKH